MAPPAAPTYSSRPMDSAFDPSTMSDNEDEDDNRSTSSRSTWASTSSATILGFSDGYVGRGGAELSDWRVSRIGGAPTFPPMFAPQLQPSASECLSCTKPMPLLTQIYCPLEASPLERVLFVFGCPRRSCRGKNGTLRCWRASTQWPEEEEEVEEIKVEKKDAGNGLGNLIFGGVRLVDTSAVNFNPFAPSSTVASSNTSLSSNPFLTSPILPPSVPNLTSSMEQTTLAPKIPRSVATLPPSPDSWPSPPSYPSQYLTTAYEPSSPVSSTLPPHTLVPTSKEEDSKHREGKGAGGRTKKGADVGGTGSGSGAGDEWGKEGYEVMKVKGVDEVFLGFQERVGREGKQCIRYDHSSAPLPFSSTSKPYTTLFPTPTATNSDETRGRYNPSLLPSCSRCTNSLTFELQLMPHLVGLLNRSSKLDGCTALGSAEDGAGAKAKGVMEEDGFEWASVWIFTCLGECLGRGEADEVVDGWKEELVMIEWEE